MKAFGNFLYVGDGYAKRIKKEFELFDWRRPVGWIRILNELLLQLQKSTGVVTFVPLSELFLTSRLVHPQLCLGRTLKLLVICPRKHQF